ncbi:alanine racemase [Paenarthrobacter nicotinovorans]|jgi:alanine racemase|uniref:alanine racemase n=1 Tax=Paenarthrobacter nicotinovorans TaxID=29320 RepID=UPI0027848631|nr:alanine racemase [Paenarthrobacter nicotinovorans]MDP9933915.1 alanine racemase [Paenarthrobacter nicotinovorans]
MLHPAPPVRRTDNLASWLEVDGDAFEANVRAVRELLRDRASLCTVIKSDAYGHGAELLMPALVRSGVPYIGVGSNREAAIARSHGFTGKLLRVRAAAPQEIAAAVGYGVEELVADPQSAWEINRIAAAAGRVVRIHLDINSSGISRHSLDVSSALGRASAAGILSHGNLELAGVMTHFPLDDVRDIEAGLVRFQEQATSILQAAGIPREQVLLHAANSYATLNVPSALLDMVRTGALLYGDSDLRHPGYRRCLAFKARIGSVNCYPAGSKVGYGHLHTLRSEARLATVTAGYGDGYRRALAMGGSVLVRGQRVPVVDAVSMNSMVVDVSDVADVCPGDEVVLFGRQGSQEITVDELESANGNILADLYTVWAGGSRVLASEAAM